MRKLIVRLRFKMYLLLTLVYAGVALLSTLLFIVLIPSKYFGVYPLIDVFYWLCGVGMTLFLDRARRRSCSPDGLLKVFMIFRGIKFLLTVGLLAVGVHGLGMERISFAISLMCNYFVYSGLELYVYHRYTKRLATGKWK